MNGREQPYIDRNAPGFYERTDWVDDVPDIQVGTPLDEFHFNNMEAGINSANLHAEFLTEVLGHRGSQINNIDGEVITAESKNETGVAYFGATDQTITLKQNRDTLDYSVTVEITEPTDNVGDIIISDKQVNGFKVKHTGSAKSVPLKLFVRGGNAS